MSAAAAKRALLGFLADEAVVHRGLAVDPEALAATTRWYRSRFDLVRPAELEGFLARADVSRDAFDEHIRTLHNVDTLLAHDAARIDERLPRYRGVLSARDWLLRREDER
jgi:hypothetical protein